MDQENSLSYYTDGFGTCCLVSESSLEFEPIRTCRMAMGSVMAHDARWSTAWPLHLVKVEVLIAVDIGAEVGFGSTWFDGRVPDRVDIPIQTMGEVDVQF